MKKQVVFFISLIVLLLFVSGCGSGAKTVIELSGDNSKKSGLFELKTSNAKMEFNVEGEEPLVFSVFVVPEGETFDQNILTPDATTTEQKSNTIDLGKEPGKYFLQVISARADWSITITEEQ